MLWNLSRHSANIEDRRGLVIGPRTHGTSEQRMQWFRRDLESGRIEPCSAFRE